MIGMCIEPYVKSLKKNIANPPEFGLSEKRTKRYSIILLSPKNPDKDSAITGYLIAKRNK